MKSGMSRADQESFKVYSGSFLLYTGSGFVNGEIRTIEQCLTSSTNDQYILELLDSSGNSWSSGSDLAIYGKYGNAVFKSSLCRTNRKAYSFSLYYGIEKDSIWKMTSGSITAGWTAYSFSDSTWTDATLGSVTTTVSGTQYFRRQFVGLSNMAAYDVRLNYKAGVIAYINGAEVYRDNMPAGDVTAATPATGQYTELAYHGFIRSGTEVVSKQSILAVEVHYLTPQSTVDFNAYLAILDASIKKGKCFLNDDSLKEQSSSFGYLRGVVSKITVHDDISDLQYDSSVYQLVLGTNVDIAAPTYVGVIISFFLAEGTYLPAGLSLNDQTGEITGVPTEEEALKTYTIFGRNTEYITFTTINISVRKGMCKAEGMLPTSMVGDSYLVTDCSLQGDFVGEIRKSCVLGQVDGEWVITGECKPIGGEDDESQGSDKPDNVLSSTTIIIIIVCVVVLLIVIFVCVIACYKHKNNSNSGSVANPSKKLPIKNKDEVNHKSEKDGSISAHSKTSADPV